MMFAYTRDDRRLVQLPLAANPAKAIRIDLYRPQPHRAKAVRQLWVDVPTLADMDEIAVPNRLYHEGGVDCLTVVLPGLSESKAPLSGPVCCALTPDRRVTVRHHAPRPFETYPARADKVGPGLADPQSLFLSLIDEVIGRLADLLEGSGRALDQLMARVFHDRENASDAGLQQALQDVARESDLVGRVRLSLLTVERAVSHFGQSLTGETRGTAPRPVVKGPMPDIHALELRGDVQSGRVAMATDVTLGMVNLAQSKTVKIVSVVAAIFLPPTVIASADGMYFARLPELALRSGSPMALALMLASGVGTFFFFKWTRWL